MKAIIDKYFKMKLSADQAIQAKNYNLAIIICNQLITCKLPSAEFSEAVYNMKGFSLFNLGKYFEAIGCFTNALNILEKYPTEFKLLNEAKITDLRLRALCFQKLGEYTKSLKDFETIYKIDPKGDASLLEKAQLYIIIKKISKAEKCLLELLDRAKQWPNYNFWKSQVEQVKREINEKDMIKDVKGWL